jgi:hypothetical protein
MVTRNQDNEKLTSHRILTGLWILLILVLIGITSIWLAPDLAQDLWRTIGIWGGFLQPLDVVLGIASFLVLIIKPVWRVLSKELERWVVVEKLTVVGTTIDRLKRYRTTALVVLVISLIFYIVIATAPLFKITYPKDGTTIVSTSRSITVEGKGAEPGGMVVVYVFDGSTPYPQQGIAHIDQRGNWSVDNVILQTEDYTYVIWAETAVDSGSIRTINRPRVTRTTSAKSYGAIIGATAVVILLLIMGTIWFILKRRRRVKDGGQKCT